MPTVDAPPNLKLETAQAYLIKCEAELAALTNDSKWHPSMRAVIRKDLVSEIKAWKEVIAVLTPKGEPSGPDTTVLPAL